jgi:Ras-related protein Rab-8A
VVKVLVGNKSDSPKRAVSYEEGRKLAADLGVGFFETSAKENNNVTEMFLEIGG